MSSSGDPFIHPPAHLMTHVISHVIGLCTSDWPARVQPSVELLQCYRTQLCDHIQGETLLGLGTGMSHGAIVWRLVPVCREGFNVYHFPSHSKGLMYRGSHRTWTTESRPYFHFQGTGTGYKIAVYSV